MSTVSIVGMIAGGILVLTAVVVFLAKKEFPAGGIMVTAIGLVLIGMSQWTSIKLSGLGINIEVLRNEIAETAAAADEVAAQAEQAAAGLEATKQQLASLTRQLDANRALPGRAAQPIQQQISSIPTVDRSKLTAARATLRTLRDRNAQTK